MKKTISHYYSILDEHLYRVIGAICRSSIQIEEAIRYSALTGSQGDRSDQNSSGDIQKKLDVICNEIMIKELADSGACNVLLSEENNDPIYVLEKASHTHYLVAFDPLDGSSNLDCNGPVGTIFSISANKGKQVLLSGDQILVSGYVLYGPSTELVLSVNKTVDRFVLSSNKEYIHLETVRLDGKKKKIYSVNEGNSVNWNADMKAYIEGYKKEGMNYTSRYIGSMVGDVHRTLMYGGMFSYPADKKSPNGKLRLLYEAYPMAKLIEDAGGKAIIGNMSTKRILEIEPKEIHQRTPIVLGSREEVDRYRIMSKL